MSRAQKRLLKFYMHFRNKEMTFLALMQYNWRKNLLIITLAVFSVIVATIVVNDFFAWLVGTWYVSLLCRDMAYCFRSTRTWPIIKESLDWTKIDQLASSNRLTTQSR